MSHQPERALTHIDRGVAGAPLLKRRNESSAREGIDTRELRKSGLNRLLVEMSHQPERALTPVNGSGETLVIFST